MVATVKFGGKLKSVMKNIFSFLFVSLVVFVSAMVAKVQEPVERQQARTEKNRKVAVAKSVIENEVNSSLSSRRLDERLLAVSKDNDFSQIISEIVRANDRSVIPYLKARLVVFDRRNLDIEVALVKLGDREYFDKAVTDLSSTDVILPYYAVWKLSLFKTKEAYRKLYELLDDETNRDENPSDDAVIETLSSIVKDRLAQTVDNPPQGMDKYNTKVWKAWFARNKRLIE